MGADRPAAGGGTAPPVTSGAAGNGPGYGVGEQPGVIAPAPAGVGAAPALGGSSAPVSPADCGTVTQMAELERGPADIVWIIDGSASMVDELATVQNNITNFANTIGGVGIDHHVVMLTTADLAASTPLGMDPQHYLYVPALVDSHNALQLLLDQYPQYEPFLRRDAALHFIVISDDESAIQASDFLNQMGAKAGKSFSFHAIASEDVNGLPCVGACGLPIVCGGFAPGRQYYALADATHGQKISICTSDWSQVFGALQEAVIASAPLPCDYAIPAPPAGEKLDRDEVNLEYSAPTASSATFPRASDAVACADHVAWYYDDPGAPKQIKMCPAACDAISGGGSIRIRLGCATVPVVLD
jgi:hypothetical protein